MSDSKNSQHSYGSLMDLRMRRLTETKESPQFGCENSMRDAPPNQNNLYTMNKQDELEDAQVYNTHIAKLFRKQSTVFSFNGSEKSSKTSEGVGNVIRSDSKTSSKL